MKGIPDGGVGKPVAWLLASWCCALLAMKTKEISFTIPITVMLFECSFFAEGWRKRILLVLPYLLIALLIPLSLVRMDQPLEKILSEAGAHSRLQTSLPRDVYLFTQLRVIATYLRLIVLPVNLNLDYDYPIYHSLIDLDVLLSLLLILLVIGSALLLFSRSARRGDARMRISAFGIFWFFAALSVESSVIPIADVIFEHRLYLPMVAAILAIVPLASLGLERIPLGSKRIWAPVLSTVVLLTLAGATYARNGVWKDNLALWEDVVGKSPGKPRTHLNLGYAYSERGRTDEAIEQYLLSIRLSPEYAEAWDNLGVDYAKKGRLSEAIEAHEKAVSIDPTFPQPYYNLGRIYLTSLPGNEGEAARLFREALSFKPDYTDAWVNLSAASLRRGDFQGAGKAGERAIALDPERADGHFNLAVARFRLGDRRGAMAEMEIVKGLDPGLAGSLERFIAGP